MSSKRKREKANKRRKAYEKRHNREKNGKRKAPKPEPIPFDPNPAMFRSERMAQIVAQAIASRGSRAA